MLTSLLLIIKQKIISSKSWMKLKVETIIKVLSPFHSIFYMLISLAPSIFLSHFLVVFFCCIVLMSRSYSCCISLFQVILVASSFLCNVYFSWAFSFRTSFFVFLSHLKVTCFILRLLGETKLKR